MAKKDISAKEFMSNPDNLADMINNKLFNGRKVISPQQIQERDSAFKIHMDIEKISKLLKIPMERYRDVYKEVVLLDHPDQTFFFIGIENQSTIDFLMPLRVALYDLIAILKQFEDQSTKRKERNKKKKNKKQKRLLSTEAAYRKKAFRKAKPVITFVVNLTGKKWTGPTTLEELIDFTDFPKELFPLHSRLILIDPAVMTEEELNGYTSDVRVLYDIMSKKDRAQQFDYALKQRETLKNIDSSIVGYLDNFFDFNFTENLRKEEENLLESAREFREDLMILAERKRNIEVAQSLLRDNIPIKVIKNATGLSKKEIKKIQKSMESNTEDQDL